MKKPIEMNNSSNTQKRISTFFITVLYTILFMTTLFIIAKLNYNYVEYFVQNFKTQYYIVINSLVFVVLPISNILIFKYCYNNEKIQIILEKLFD